ncbi:hypothetical protein HAX54_022384 [Datura stramonium]|uniref:Uncharacterized protein n=1 Tax=Datura stramonium TaxID=4076 RepID=A0ABS8UWA2_DATST|nr:hypothetical protein [Datura stramonium]
MTQPQEPFSALSCSAIIVQSMTFGSEISQPTKKRGQAYVVSPKKSSLSVEVPLRKKRNIEKSSFSRTVAEIEFLTSPPCPDPIFNEDLVKKDEDTYEEILIPRRSRSSLAEELAPRSGNH